MMKLYIDFVYLIVYQHKPITSSPRLRMHAQVVARHGFSVPEWEDMVNLLATIACNGNNLRSHDEIPGFDGGCLT